MFPTIDNNVDAIVQTLSSFVHFADGVHIEGPSKPENKNGAVLKTLAHNNKK
jgi:hypothetical protein